ncbi:hypothetical protein HAX54_012807, partial [Datura stramonium]|nr:hypothetical protein [Datura stramonium]
QTCAAHPFVFLLSTSSALATVTAKSEPHTAASSPPITLVLSPLDHCHHRPNTSSDHRTSLSLCLFPLRPADASQLHQRNHQTNNNRTPLTFPIFLSLSLSSLPSPLHHRKQHSSRTPSLSRRYLLSEPPFLRHPAAPVGTM